MPAARGATTTTTTSRCRDINHARPLSIGRLCGGATGARGKTLHNVGDFRHWPPAEIKASDLFENQCNQLVGELPFEFMASKQIDGRAGRATHTHLMLLFVVVCCCSLLLLLLVWKNCRNAPAQPNETGRRPAIHLASNRKRAAQQANWWLYDHLPFRPNDIKRRPNDIRPRAWHWAAGNTVAAILLSVCPFVWRSCCRRILLLRVRGRALQMGDPYIMRQEWRQVEWGGGGRPAAITITGGGGPPKWWRLAGPRIHWQMHWRARNCQMENVVAVWSWLGRAPTMGGQCLRLPINSKTHAHAPSAPRCAPSRPVRPLS